MTADERAEKLAGLREYADWLEANPDVPLPFMSTFSYFPEHAVTGRAPALAELYRVAAILGVEPGTPYGTGPDSHAYAFGPRFRGGISYEVAVCRAAEDFARGVGKVAGPVEGSGSATAPTESAAGVLTPPADGAPDAGDQCTGGAPAAVPVPVVTGDGAAVTPDVWVARRRRGILYHQPDVGYTVCGRAVRANGSRLPLAEATAFGAVPCPRCYGEQVAA